MKASKPHRKHAKLARPALGRFGRCEWAIMGIPSETIQGLVRQLSVELGSRYKLAYATADDKDADEPVSNDHEQSSILAHAGTFEYTDKINFHRIDFEAHLQDHQFRMLFNDQDLILVNGNHLRAARQIVVVDARKENALWKQSDRLTDVQLFLLAQEAHEIPSYLKEVIDNWSEVPVLKLSDVAAIAAFLKQQMNMLRPPLAGLVLAGGKSQRMGRDKGLLEYYGKPQRDHMMALVKQHCKETYLSVRPGQLAAKEAFVLEDTFIGLGPFGAIASAFRHDPNRAWLVAAVDLPLLDKATLDQLVAGRNPSKLATAFKSPHNAFPEPLMSIWEPRAYPVLLNYLAQGHSSPRKVLIDSDVELLDIEREEALTNVNHPEEFEGIMKQLGKSG
ncbi:MAG: NTP transferase domain-containing protein [Bacteroidota bacterium]